ncbi:PREDICTED: uncharacterized protein LOC105596687 [Cercocebus atys]|uniref:uncharacterized protein LOC105596687 n=1 Tax=Cercocebus atys TaxID=9531 RepID=UPI0005F58B7F|nr:PREDICTED: uncharacterized protein LOC105596687 [Cercocebus atys]
MAMMALWVLLLMENLASVPTFPMAISGDGGWRLQDTHALLLGPFQTAFGPELKEACQVYQTLGHGLPRDAQKRTLTMCEPVAALAAVSVSSQAAASGGQALAQQVHPPKIQGSERRNRGITEKLFNSYPPLKAQCKSPFYWILAASGPTCVMARITLNRNSHFCTCVPIQTSSSLKAGVGLTHPVRLLHTHYLPFALLVKRAGGGREDCCTNLS